MQGCTGHGSAPAEPAADAGAVDDEDGLVYLANQGCLTFHCWLPQADRLRQPDRLIVDLDPPDTADAFSTVRATALRLRKVFEQLGLTAFVQTTGSRGLHVVARNGYAQTVVAPYSVRARPGAPVATPLDWDEVRTTRLTPDRWTIGNIFRRLGAKADPWRGINQHARPLNDAWPRLERLTASWAS